MEQRDHLVDVVVGEQELEPLLVPSSQR